MAGGEYILIEVDLAKQRKTLAIARRCKWSAYEAVGQLVEFWGWVTSQPVVVLDDGETGALVDVTVDALVDARVAPRVLLEALLKVEWLGIIEIENQPALTIPRYNSWLSISGKARTLKSLRQRRWRQGVKTVGADVGADVGASRSGDVGASKKLEVRGSSKEEPRAQGGKRFVKPTIDDVAAYCKQRKNSIDPTDFWNHYESKGWVIGKSPMKSWQAAIVTWERKRGEHQGSSPPQGKSTDDDLRPEFTEE